MTDVYNGGKSVTNDLYCWIKENLFNVVPMSIAVIDQEFNLVYANSAFEQMFGTWKNRKCYTVYKSRLSMCPDCRGSAAFKDGVSRVNVEVGYNKNGKLTRYIKHTVPVIDNDGNVPFLVEMATDITETEQIRREYQLLFDQVPCNILIIDRDFRIVRTNKKLREMFGSIEGEYCFEVFKGQSRICSNCLARRTFENGQMHIGDSIVKDKEGKTVHLHVTYVPLDVEDGKFDFVMEVAVDVTHILKLEDELKVAYSFMESMIETSLDGIIAINENSKVTIFNPAARKLFNIDENRQITENDIDYIMPSGFMNQVYSGPKHVYLPETTVKAIGGQSFPVRLAGIKLKVENRFTGMAFWIQDLREIKKLEADKLEAERLAAVGQTVAGLAHGVKNLITGLEGGMYMLSSGMKKSDVARISKGMEMLERNIGRVSKFVKAFLNFSKGREIYVELSDPEKIAKEVVELYSPKVQEYGIELVYEFKGNIPMAPLDSESMHECLTNLVGNAIDACRMSDNKRNCHVWVRAFEENGTIVYEVVDDGCGMDYEIKKKVFTTFFTTKGLGGTGLGLLMTKKIVHEHGGKISLESEPGKGTTFRIILPRKHLPSLNSSDSAET